MLCLVLAAGYFLPSFYLPVHGCRRATLEHVAGEPAPTMAGLWGGGEVGPAADPPDDGGQWETLTGGRSPCVGRRQT